MKFHTNTNEEKLFKKVAIVCLALFIVILIVYFITFSNDCLRLLGPLFLCIPICFYISNLLKKDFVEFSEDKIIFLNHKGVNFEINIEEVKMIMIPTIIPTSPLTNLKSVSLANEVNATSVKTIAVKALHKLVNLIFL